LLLRYRHYLFDMLVSLLVRRMTLLAPGPVLFIILCDGTRATGKGIQAQNAQEHFSSSSLMTPVCSANSL